MSKIKLFIAILSLSLILSIAILAGIKVYKEFRIKSDLAAVGLPTKDGYMGGTYPKWEPMEFTYKNYKGEPSIDSPEFKEVSLKKRDCDPWTYPFYRNMTIEEIHKLAETDPDAMYHIAIDKKIIANGVDLIDIDNATALEYLEKAAVRGHVLANIDLTDYMDDEDKIKSKLDAYAKITPYAEGKIESILDILGTEDTVRIDNIIRNANQYFDILLFLYFASPILEKHGIILPDFEDYWCEAYFRGCVSTLPHEIKCSQ
ncbi:MAG: hypothetical protein LBH05_02775 [Deferribacteraceae bacterium]|jgi:hypothetical protein|nr:hypothetical protein [Deferribacteraceae bacterium]